MAYAAFSVVFGEQPSAAKWNILGSNDASFNDGTGIANMATSTTSISNPYKFAAQNAVTQNITDSVATKITFGTEKFDTNNNFASSTYTVPVTGFYQFDANVQVAGSVSTLAASSVILYKNGAALYNNGLYPTNATGSSVFLAQSINILESCTAGDTLEVYAFGDVVGGVPQVSSGQATFSGFLVSQT